MLSVTLGSALDLGGAGSDAIFDTAVDGAGNSYVAGYFSGTVDFDLSRVHAGDADTVTSRGSQDAFVAKYAPDDSLLWVRRMGGDVVNAAAVTDTGRSLSLDAAGNVFVVGEFYDSADFGASTLTSVGDRDAFVVKLNSSGTVQWARRWGVATGDQGYGGDVDAQGNVYTVSLQSSAVEVVKFTASGATAWSQTLATGAWLPPDIAVSAAGKVFVAGTFSGAVDFDPSGKVKSVSAGPMNGGFVWSLNTNGKLDWVTPFVGRTVGSTNGYAFASTVQLDASGNVLVGGLYRNSVDFNPSSATTTLDTTGGAFVTKLNSSGALVWAKALTNAGSGGTILVEGMDIDAAGNIYASGSFHGSIDLDPGVAADVHATAGSSDVYLVKLTSAGNYAWGTTFGGVGSDVGHAVVVDSAGYVHLAGFYADTVDFDPDPLASFTLGSAGAARNGFRLRLRQA